MEKVWIWMLWYAVIWNMIGLFLMWTDKQRAKWGKWRIPEKMLFLCSILGGSIGTWAGMYLFRHKTKHWYFVVGMPLIVVVQVLGIFWIIK